MNTLIVLATVLAVAVAIPADTYNSKYDNFDIDEVTGNKRLLLNYTNCFLREGPCTAEGNEFYKIIPEVLKTKCAKCTPKQRQHIRKMCKAISDQLPEKWDQLTKKEDPKGEYKNYFQEFLNSTD